MTSATATPNATAQPPKAIRTAKGRRPQYFADPATDKLLFMVISLAGELSVARERIDALERVLQAKGVLQPSEVDNFRPTPEVEKIREEKRSRFIARFLRVVEAELREITGEDMPGSREAILKTLVEC